MYKSIKVSKFISISYAIHYDKKRVTTYDIHERTKLLIEIKKMFKEECCKQYRHVKFKGTITEWPVQKQTHRTIQKHVEHQDATDIKKTIFD